MTSTEQPKKVVPAQVGFLAIYNPSLGTTDESIDNQIVYFSSAESRNRRRYRTRNSKSVEATSKDERNEQLRQIGLAQGMVEFGRSFSDGANVNTIETEKSRIILHELEAGWWILASIELTKLPSTKANATSSTKGDTIEDGVEYSSREVKPAALLLQDLLRAHSTFLLHHAASMSALFVRTKRPKFLAILTRYWDAYISTWSVLMHGNPAISIYGGIKVAACGELGIGVGEEERGSGEREMLEGFVDRVEGLVDLVVSRFGDFEDGGGEATPTGITKPAKQSGPWLGSGDEPAMEDGAIFLGVGALSRKSLRDITHWMEDLYTWGPDAYGVTENPSSTRRRRKHKRSVGEIDDSQEAPQRAVQENPGENARDKARQVYGLTQDQKDAEDRKSSTENGHAGPSKPKKRLSTSSTWRRSKSHEQLTERRPTLRTLNSDSSHASSIDSKPSRIVSFMKLGYGTHWTLGGGGSTETQESGDGQDEAKVNSPTGSQISPLEHVDPSPAKKINNGAGHYLIGLLGDIEQDDIDDSDLGHASEDSAGSGGDRRTLLRIITVELEREADARPEADISIDLSTHGTSEVSSKHGSQRTTGGASTHGSFESQDRNKARKLQVVVYVNKPFIYTFLFEQRTASLDFVSLYRSLHHQLGPLQKPLISSTTYRSSRPDITTTSPADNTAAPIYDLVFDSKTLIVNCTIPSIPTAAQVATLGPQGLLPWSRVEALNTHSQILNTFVSTRNESKELERTCKTSRGYWVVWNRIPGPEDHGKIKSHTTSPSQGSPIYLPEDRSRSYQQTRNSRTQEGESLNPSTRSTAHPFLDEGINTLPNIPNYKEILLVRKASDYVAGRSSGMFKSGSSESGWGSNSVKLAHGIGVDTKRYIEGLLRLT